MHGILEETNEIDFEEFEKCLNIIFMTLSISEKYYLLNVKPRKKANNGCNLNQNNYNSLNFKKRNQEELNEYLSKN